MIIAVEDIMAFFTTSSREKNDTVNKIRENILKIISNPPKEYLENKEYSHYWNIVHQEWDNIIKIIVNNYELIYNNIRIEITLMGGRSRHYDIDLRCYVENTLEKSIKIEFKNGGFKLTDLPQILSLRARFPIIDESYDKFYYENYLDQYILCDEEITEIKPSLETYLQKITSVNYDIHPFFEQLRKYENNHKNTKNEIVNKSITDYLQ